MVNEEAVKHAVRFVCSTVDDLRRLKDPGLRKQFRKDLTRTICAAEQGMDVDRFSAHLRKGYTVEEAIHYSRGLKIILLPKSVCSTAS